MQPFVFLALPLAASAHFLFDFPMRRGFNDDTAAKFPCGGFDTPSSNRTSYPLSGGPIQLDMHHTAAHVQVLLGIGNDPGSAYNIVLRPTFLEMGPNNFCMADVNIPSSANLTAGMNATIQVVTNGDPNGGLYQCADITIIDSQLSSDVISANCKNSTGVTTKAMTGAAVNANETTESTSSDSSASGSSSASASAATSTSTGAAATYTMAFWAVGALGAAAGLLAV